MKKKKSFHDVSIFIVSLLVFAFVSGCYFHLDKCIDNERSSINKRAELLELGFRLSSASDYLTTEVRNFSITLNPVHLRNYWTEINVTKTREKVIARLTELDTQPEEFSLLNTAKNNSDALVNTEIRAMKLILEVYEVSEEQMGKEIGEYQLTSHDEALSFNEKINLSREILFDSGYEKAKIRIMEPIEQFKTMMNKRVLNESHLAQAATNKAKNTLLFAILLASCYIFYLVWFFLYRISIPLKKYFSELKAKEEQEEKDAGHSMQSIDVIAAIKALSDNKKSEDKTTGPD